MVRNITSTDEILVRPVTLQKSSNTLHTYCLHPTGKKTFRQGRLLPLFIPHTHLVSSTTIFNMKYTITVATLVAIVAAQDISTLPVCSLSCFATSIPATGCGLTDFACSCGKAAELTPQVTPCIEAACSAADQAAAVAALVAICDAVGVPITVPTPGTTSSAAPVEPEPTSSAAPVEPEPTSSAAPVEPEPTTEPEEPEEPAETPVGMHILVPFICQSILT